MTKERRILSWVALAGSLLVCCPCAALSSFVAFIGGYSMLGNTAGAPARDDLFNMIAFGTLGSVAVVVGLALFYWGVRNLLTTEDTASSAAPGASSIPPDGGQE
jgi:hypothetical protein